MPVLCYLREVVNLEMWLVVFWGWNRLSAKAMRFFSFIYLLCYLWQIVGCKLKFEQDKTFSRVCKHWVLLFSVVVLINVAFGLCGLVGHLIVLCRVLVDLLSAMVNCGVKKLMT